MPPNYTKFIVCVSSFAILTLAVSPAAKPAQSDSLPAPPGVHPKPLDVLPAPGLELHPCDEIFVRRFPIQCFLGQKLCQSVWNQDISDCGRDFADRCGHLLQQIDCGYSQQKIQYFFDGNRKRKHIVLQRIYLVVDFPYLSMCEY